MIIQRLLYLLLLSAGISLVFSGCAKEKSDQQALDTEFAKISQDYNDIRRYLREKRADSGLNVHPSGLCYKIIREGNGNDVINFDQVPSIIYTRHLLPSEKLVESSLGLPTSLDGRQLKNHILGWQIGLRLITKGGRIIMYIPSPLAFGATGIPGAIPPNSILICDVTLVDFK